MSDELLPWYESGPGIHAMAWIAAQFYPTFCCVGCQIMFGVRTGCCCTPLHIGATSATLAIVALFPMAYIPFWVSPLHFVAAAVVFIMLVRYHPTSEQNHGLDSVDNHCSDSTAYSRRCWH